MTWIVRAKWNRLDGGWDYVYFDNLGRPFTKLELAKVHATKREAILAMSRIGVKAQPYVVSYEDALVDYIVDEATK